MIRPSRRDPYAILQVAPDASPDEVTTAYERLQSLYSADRYVDGPPEFAAQAEARRQELAAAYTAISSGAAGMRPQGQVEVIDYRPLPPAQRQERPTEVVPEVLPRLERGTTRRLSPPAGLGILGAVVALIFLLVTLPGVRTYRGASVPAPSLPGVTLPYTTEQITELRRTAERSPSLESWTALGNAMFDNIEILREVASDSPQYADAARRWPEVTTVYERALQQRDDAAVRISMALSLLYYGTAVDDEASRARGVSEAQQAWAAAPDNNAVALRYGLALVALDPPQTAEAVTAWQTIVTRAPESVEARQAQALIKNYT